MLRHTDSLVHIWCWAVMHMSPAWVSEWNWITTTRWNASQEFRLVRQECPLGSTCGLLLFFFFRDRNRERVDWKRKWEGKIEGEINRAWWTGGSHIISVYECVCVIHYSMPARISLMILLPVYDLLVYTYLGINMATESRWCHPIWYI